MMNSLSGISTQISGLSAQTLELEALFKRLKSGHSLITGNSRLAHVLTNNTINGAPIRVTVSGKAP